MRSDDDYLALFLEPFDLPGMRMMQDLRLLAADPDDDSYRRHGGTHGGKRVWMADGDDVPLWQLADVRWLFRTPEGATAYHREHLFQAAEGHPAVFGAPPVGQGCAVFGGIEPHPLLPDLSFTAYFYVFRAGSAVVKIFVAQSMSLPPGTLTPADVVPIARRAEEIALGAVA